MTKHIGIETTRYSKLLKEILNSFSDDIIIQIGDKTYNPKKFNNYSSSDIPFLLENWCSNESIKNTTFFTLKQNSTDLFWWWDHPDNLNADISVLPFIKKLFDDKVLKYRIVDPKKPKILILLKGF